MLYIWNNKTPFKSLCNVFHREINTASRSGYDTDSKDYHYSLCVPHALSCAFCVQSCELAFACDITKIPSLNNSHRKRYENIWVDLDYPIKYS